MIAKKNSRYDLERKRIVLFQVGLFTTSSFLLAAFTYKTPVEISERKKEVKSEQVRYLVAAEKSEKKEIELPKLKLPPIAPPSAPTVQPSGQISTAISAVSNTTTTVTASTGVSTGTLTVGTVDIINDGNITATFDEVLWPDVDATFIGGFEAMSKYIVENIQYPQDAAAVGIQGIVFLSFVVEKDGSISSVRIERGVDKSIDREATRIIRSFPNWIPGEVKAQKVRTRVNGKINFTLE